jgi:hypothetical protein
MTHAACLVCLVSTVSGCRKHTLWKAITGSGHKTKQAGQQGRQAGWQGSQGCLICFRSGLPALFYAPTSVIALLEFMFHKLICVEQSTFLRYLCSYDKANLSRYSWNFLRQTYFHSKGRGILTAKGWCKLCSILLRKCTHEDFCNWYLQVLLVTHHFKIGHFIIETKILFLLNF